MTEAEAQYRYTTTEAAHTAMLDTAVRLGRPVHDLTRVIAYDWTPNPDYRCGHRDCLCATLATPEPQLELDL